MGFCAYLYPSVYVFVKVTAHTLSSDQVTTCALNVVVLIVAMCALLVLSSAYDFACAADSLRVVLDPTTPIPVWVFVGGLIFLLIVATFIVLLWRRRRDVQPTHPGDVGSSSILIELVDSPGSVTDSVWQHEPTHEVSAPDLALRRVMDWATGCC